MRLSLSIQPCVLSASTLSFLGEYILLKKRRQNKKCNCPNFYFSSSFFHSHWQPAISSSTVREVLGSSAPWGPNICEICETLAKISSMWFSGKCAVLPPGMKCNKETKAPVIFFSGKHAWFLCRSESQTWLMDMERNKTVVFGGFGTHQNCDQPECGNWLW